MPIDVTVQPHYFASYAHGVGQCALNQYGVCCQHIWYPLEFKPESLWECKSLLNTLWQCGLERVKGGVIWLEEKGISGSLLDDGKTSPLPSFPSFLKMVGSWLHGWLMSSGTRSEQHGNWQPCPSCGKEENTVYQMYSLSYSRSRSILHSKKNFSLLIQSLF